MEHTLFVLKSHLFPPTNPEFDPHETKQLSIPPPVVLNFDQMETNAHPISTPSV